MTEEGLEFLASPSPSPSPSPSTFSPPLTRDQPVHDHTTVSLGALLSFAAACLASLAVLLVCVSAAPHAFATRQWQWLDWVRWQRVLANARDTVDNDNEAFTLHKKRQELRTELGAPARQKSHPAVPSAVVRVAAAPARARASHVPFCGTQVTCAACRRSPIPSRATRTIRHCADCRAASWST